jgi:hypothetical protein
MFKNVVQLNNLQEFENIVFKNSKNQNLNK